jgi:hypothetical protein
VNHEVACFSSTFDSIIDARTVTTELGVRSYGISEAESQNWAKIQQDVKTFESRTRKLNKAGNRMRLLQSHYYCGKEFADTLQCGKVEMKSVKKICRPDDGQCQECLVAEAELAQEIQPQFVSDSERGDREKDIRMCPRCFGGYFINIWCNDLAAHQGQSKEFRVKNVCPGIIRPHGLRKHKYAPKCLPVDFFLQIVAFSLQIGQITPKQMKNSRSKN